MEQIIEIVLFISMLVLNFFSLKYAEHRLIRSHPPRIELIVLIVMLVLLGYLSGQFEGTYIIAALKTTTAANLVLYVCFSFFLREYNSNQTLLLKLFQYRILYVYYGIVSLAQLSQIVL